MYSPTELQSKWLLKHNSSKEIFKFVKKDAVLCQYCEKAITVTQKCQLDQHAKSETHKNNEQLKQKRSASQAILEESFQGGSKKSKTNVVGHELCTAMLSANIPFHKMRNEAFRGFLEKHLALKLPDVSAMNREYLDGCYKEVFKKIQEELQGGPIWVGVDETTDPAGRYTAIVLIGKLDSQKAHAPYLAACKFLDKTNAGTVARLVNDTIREYFPTFKAENLKALISDGASYMLLAGKTLKTFYPSMLHATCLAHALHRVCETIREAYHEVNDLIATIKRIFSKAPARIVLWKECNPEIPLPPEPVLTRWGTWLEAAVFHAINYKAVKQVVDQLDSNDAAAIHKGQDLLKKRTIEQDLVFIQTHFSFLPGHIQALEKRGLSLQDTFELMEKTEEKLQQVPGTKGDRMIQKFEAVLKRNPDLPVFQKAAKIMDGEKLEEEMPESLDLQDVPFLRYCPLVSVDVERSFSSFKQVLTDRRHNLTPENINKLMVCSQFYSRSSV